MPSADPNPVYPANLTVSIGANQSVAIGGDSSTTVQRNEVSTVQSNQSLNVGKDLTVVVGKNVVLRAGDSISIVCGAASLTLKKDGTIIIKGKDLTLDASGKLNAKASSDTVIKGSKIGSN
jgi:type VI secretion system secreted protein VgrG